MRIIELFGGIGACTHALKRLGIGIETVDYVEIDKFAVKSYNAINGTDFAPQDITKWVKNLSDIDLIMHGSPCQDFSVAGAQKGGDDGSGTRSSLLYESLRVIEKIRPRFVIWENVKNVLNAKHRPNFDKYLARMESLGYNNFYQVLNAKDYGIPQNRERVFVVSILDGGGYSFPPKIPLEITFRDLLEPAPAQKYFNIGGTRKHESAPINRPISGDYAPTLCATMGEGGNNVPIFCDKYELSEERYRKLTPKECWRLMGFSDEAFERARAVNSDTQLYKQAGNSIVVNVLTAILKNLIGGEVSWN